jgi:putative peptidoglycan lipid II flippase
MATTLGYGAFTPRDVEMASYALMAYSWGLLGFSLVKVLAPGYFARQDTRTPVRVGLIALGTSMALNIAVVLPAQHFGFPYPHILIASATCVSAAVNTTLLWTGLKRQGVFKARAGWGSLVTRVLFANAVMAGVLLWLGGDLQEWMARSAWERAGRLSLCILAAAAAYFAALLLSGMRLRHVRNVAGA